MLSTLNGRMERLQQQLASCTVMERLRTASSSTQPVATATRSNPLQEARRSASVQPMFRLPDTSQMKAVVRVQESQVTRLKPGMRCQREGGQRRPTDRARHSEHQRAGRGMAFCQQPAVVREPRLPKEYPVELTLDETPVGVKPQDGDDDIFIDRLATSLAVPMAAVYAAGPDSYVFVKSGESVKPTKIKLGMSNDTHVVIDEGSAPTGTSVVLLQAGQGRISARGCGHQNHHDGHHPARRTSQTQRPAERRRNRRSARLSRLLARRPLLLSPCSREVG